MKMKYSESQADLKSQSHFVEFVLSKRVALVFIMLFVVATVYSKNLDGPFVYDDYSSILRNTAIRIDSLSPHTILKAGMESPLSKRPVAYITFALNYYFHGYDIIGYRIFNICIHLTNTIILFLLFGELLKLGSSLNSDQIWITAYFAAFIWAVHPIQGQSVMYVVQRMNSLAAFGFIFSCYLYLKARCAHANSVKWLLWSACILSGIFAIGSKENAATLPIVILLCEFIFFQRLEFGSLNRLLIFFGITAAVCVILSIFYLGTNFLDDLFRVQDYEFTPFKRFLTETRVVIFYLSILCFPYPSRLSFLHDFQNSQSLFQPPTTALSIFAICLVVGAAFMWMKKKPLISFSILWFFGNLVIESSFIMLDVIYEHRTYLPSMMAVFLLVYQIVGKVKPRVYIPALTCVMVVLSVGTYLRNDVWRDNYTFWGDMIDKTTEQTAPHINLGSALLKSGKTGEALSHFKEALHIQPGNMLALINIGNVKYQRGDYIKAIENYNQSIKYQKKAIERHGWPLILQYTSEAHNNMGMAFVKLGKLDEAIDHYMTALEIDAKNSIILKNIGEAFLAKKEYQRAATYYEKALEVTPKGDAQAHNNLGIAYFRLGKINQSIHQLKFAIEVDPDYMEAQENLGAIFKYVHEHSD